MNCPKCNQPIPEGKLACLPCVELAAESESERILDEFRQGAIDRFAAGKGILYLLLSNHLAHREYKTKTFCGREVKGRGKAIAFDHHQLAERVAAPRSNMCLECLARLSRNVATEAA